MTMPTLPDIIEAVQDVVSAVTGVTMAPDIPVEQIPSGGVYALLYPAAGTFSEMTAGRNRGDHILHLMVCTPRVNLRTDWARVIDAGDRVQRAILTAGTLTATVLQSNELRYTFGDLEWGGQQLIGWRFELDVLTVGALS